MSIEKQEQRRLDLQAELDAGKHRDERNRLGQFATPTGLARELLRFGRDLLGARRTIHFLDPAIGTGAFYAALRAVAPASRIGRCLGFDIDPHYARPARELWRDTSLELCLADFTAAEAPHDARKRANLVICNPPYVRHHHLDRTRKKALQAEVEARLGFRPSGLAGLYCHFLWLAHDWMAPGAVAGWLIPGEWMDVNYGTRVKDYLLDHVDLIRIHRFDPADEQFADALVSSVVVWLRNRPPGDGPVEFTSGGSLIAPGRLVRVTRQTLRGARKWTRLVAPGRARSARSPQPARPTTSAGPGRDGTLGDLFAIKRGIATGANRFFILSRDALDEHRLPWRFVQPILPSPRHVASDEIDGDEHGDPVIAQRRYLLAVDQPRPAIEARYPALWRYLQRGMDDGVHQRYLTRHRSPWYAQEHRPPAPIVCTYMGRGARAKSGEERRPFRFIRNRSRATAANVYLMLYARPALDRMIEREPGLMEGIWQALNRVPAAALLGEGRVYGGGLYKLEPRELAHLPLAALGAAVPGELGERRA